MQSTLQKHFECLDEYDFWRLHKDWGFMVVPLSERPAREVDFDAFVFMLKMILPADAKMLVMGGNAIRMSAVNGEYSMLFTSKGWPRGSEGSDIPRLQPITLREASQRASSFWGRIVPKRIRELIKGVRCARSSGHSWRYSFYCARAFRFLNG